jgi:hypothetical protein
MKPVMVPVVSRFCHQALSSNTELVRMICDCSSGNALVGAAEHGIL